MDALMDVGRRWWRVVVGGGGAGRWLVYFFVGFGVGGVGHELMTPSGMAFQRTITLR